MSDAFVAEYAPGQALRHKASGDVGKCMHRYVTPTRDDQTAWIYVVDIPRGQHYVRRTGTAADFERLDVELV